MDIIAAYIAAFNRAYPQKKVEVKFAFKRQGVPYYNVIIDSDVGARPLTEGELREAARDFVRGR